jgi:hypothetical protein
MCFRTSGNQMLIEPAAGKLGDFLQGAWLLEQMACARDNLEPGDAAEPAQGIVIEIDHHGIEPPPTISNVGARTICSVLPARSGRPPRETIAPTTSGRSPAATTAAAAPVLAPK